MSLSTPSFFNTDLPPATLQHGSGEPLILLHGVLGTPLMWSATMPLLAASSLRVIALPALGHQGGRPCVSRPCRIVDVVDDAERSLDALGLERAHLAGNSMGGWLALELARRGRARSVCALSPAGMWESSGDLDGRKRLAATVALTRWTRPFLPMLARSAVVRRFALRDNAVHGERTEQRSLIALADAVLGCHVASDLLATPEHFEPLEASCPVDVVWSGVDRIFPATRFAAVARQRIPGARHMQLEGVGHVPMIDDPELVARTILKTVSRTARDIAVQSLS